MSPDAAPRAPAALPEAFAVSRETLERLQVYVDLLYHWNRSINLVSRRSLEHVWQRHICDSLQLVEPGAAHQGAWVDLGSGAGFPGLVVAIAGGRPVTLVESDRRKAQFLREAARRTGAPVTVVAARAERLAPQEARVVSARALAALDRLLPLAWRHLAKGGVGLFPKGQHVDEELTVAAKSWKMSVEKRPSRADPGGCLLVVDALQPRYNGDTEP